jgi:thymidylate synthase ThyX
MYAATILADSLAPNGVRLTTMLVTMPRIVLAEFNTHRALSRNSASSRAIPVEKRIAAVRANPFVPASFGANRPGMQAGDDLDEVRQTHARERWLAACTYACDYAEALAVLGVHKQHANRLIEPFAWHTVVVTATEWANFFALRCHPDAQPEIRRAAALMRDALHWGQPRAVGLREWHLPFVTDEERDTPGTNWRKVAVGRCARVSYETHDGRRDPAADVALCDRLRASGHMSPFEHVATPHRHPSRIGNFKGWVQMRKTLLGEAVFSGGAA